MMTLDIGHILHVTRNKQQNNGNLTQDFSFFELLVDKELRFYKKLKLNGRYSLFLHTIRLADCETA